jgi:hypothetical protein
MSFKPEVQTDNTGKWYDNALRFATREEAEAQVHDLSYRWLAVRETRVVESDDPVNYSFVDGRLVCIPPIDTREEYLDRSKGGEQRIADRIDGYDRDDLGDSPDW